MTDTPIKPIPFRGELPKISSDRDGRFTARQMIYIHAKGSTKDEAIENWNALVTPEVRELEWPREAQYHLYSEETGFGYYNIFYSDMHEGWVATLTSRHIGTFRDNIGRVAIEKAKLACQADFARRVLSCLKGFEAEAGE